MHINRPQNVSSCNYLPQKPDIGDDVFMILTKMSCSQVPPERVLQGDGAAGDHPAPQLRLRAEDEQRGGGRGGAGAAGRVRLHQADHKSVTHIQ